MLQAYTIPTFFTVPLLSSATEMGGGEGKGSRNKSGLNIEATNQSCTQGPRTPKLTHYFSERLQPAQHLLSRLRAPSKLGYD